MVRNRSRLLSACGALVLGSLAVPARATPAADPPACVPQPYSDNVAVSVADLNADGYGDLVVGVPYASSSGLAGAGAEDIHYPNVTDGLASQHFGESYFGQTPAAGDHFGASTAFAGYTDAYGCRGLAIGAPGADGGRGRATLAHGTNAGISADDATVLTGAHPGDHFGAAIVANGSSEVWVAAPDAAVAGHAAAGAVYHYHYDVTTSQATLVQVITENSPNVPGSAAAGDHFGQTLSFQDFGDLAIGMPGKTVAGAAGAGAVAVLRFATRGQGQVVGGAVDTQDSPGVPGDAEAGDGFGSSVSLLDNVLVVGVPGEDIGTIRDAGAAQTLYNEPPGHVDGPVVRLGVGPALSQNAPAVGGSPETGDRFGASVQLGGGDEDGGVYTRLDLWIGSPGESIGTVRASGDVIPLQLTFSRKWRANGPAVRLGSGGLPGEPQTAAHVGATLGLFAGTYFPAASDVINGEGLVIDVPALDRDGTNTGEVDNVGGYNVVGAGIYQDSAGPQTGEFYGVVASNISNGSYDNG